MALSAFNDILRDLRSHSTQLSAADLVRRLGERSGLLAELRAQCKDEASFTRRRGNLDELADWFEGARAAVPATWPRNWRCCRATTRTMAATRCA